MVNNFARITGGADVHCLQLSEGLRARGHDVAFLATADPRNSEDRGEFVPLTVSNATRDHLTGRGAVGVAARALWNPHAARATQSLIRRFRPDVAHLHKLYVQLSVAPVVIASRSGVPLVQTVHDYEFIAAAATDATGGWLDHVETRAQYKLLNTLVYGVKRRIHRPRVATWIAVSRATAAVYAAAGIETTVLPNFTLKAGGQSPSPRFEDRRGVLYVGRLAEEKGVVHVLELASRAPELPVMIAGQGPLESMVRDIAGCQPNVDYLGNLAAAEVATILRAARIVLIPSLWQEPGPLAALEAMAHGTPIIAYANGGLAEYVGDARAGAVITPEASALVQSTRELYHDRSRWEALARGGPEAVSATHSLELYLDSLEQIYARAAALAPFGRNALLQAGVNPALKRSR
jgi:glycosyltransferase involved in cell wall biosynthesis